MILIVGAAIESAVLWFRSKKKLTVDFAGVWGIFGALLILTGAVPSFAEWFRKVLGKFGAGLLAVGIPLLTGSFFVSLRFSELKMENQELAVYVSLLLQENERIISELDERAQKDSVCYQYDGACRGRDSSVRASEAD